ncbi:glyoxylate/hydroxypyruvate reductase A [Postechiella marina]|uniref:Glyoxylate/hydroxypyruvate reductase A n=1 Tax=Postechiella marina TaxID=943941 RepID=A0ABP8CAJ6_9FLAO
MSIVLIFENKDATPWLNALKKKLPNTTIEVYPNVKNKDPITFAICWKPSKNVLEQFTNLKVIQSAGASIDHITNSQILPNNITITRIVDEKLSSDMWEFLITIVLAQLKNLKTYSKQNAEYIWQQHPYKSIKNTTISILGLGKIGAYVALKFAQLGFNVKGWSNSKKEISNVKSYCGKNEFNSFLNQSDFLINILPLTAQTKGILNKKTLEKLPKNAYLINVGRGEHLVDNDLIELLDNAMLAGAFLDVFRTEPLPKEHAFWQHLKIEITPHVASLTNVTSASNQITENYKRFLNKETLINTVSINKGY